MANASISYSVQKIQGGVDLSVIPVSNGVNVKYGDYTVPGFTKRSEVTFNVRYTNISQQLNNNNSITVTFTCTVGTFTRTVVNPNFTLSATVLATLDSQAFWNFTESVTHPSTHGGYTRSFSVTVPPLGTSWQSSVHFFNDMMGNYDDEFKVGMRIYNPNPPDYRPGAQRHSNVWQSHNRSAGKANKRQGGSWVTMRTQSGPNGTGNPPSIRRGGTFKNQSKIGNNAG